MGLVNSSVGIVAAVFLLTIGGHAGAVEPQSYTWSSVSFGAGGFVDGFLYHPKKAGILYARTDIGGLYRYDFQTQTWMPLLDHLGRADSELMGVLSVAIDPNDSNKVYAACGEYLGTWAHNGAILRSDDQGKTWLKVDLPLKIGGNADGRGTGERLQVDPNAGNILYFGSNQNGLWKSTDGGKSFKSAPSPTTSISLIIFDPSSSGLGQPSSTIYVGSADSKPGLFVSRDGGVTFERVPGPPPQVPQHATFASDGVLYVTFAAGEGKWGVNPGNAETGGLWKRDGKSGKWRNISPVEPDPDHRFGYSGIDTDPRHPGTVLVSTLDRWSPGDDIFETTDGGEHWMSLGLQSTHDFSSLSWLKAYMRGEDKMGHWIADLKLNPFNPDEMIYGTGYGLWVSHNLSQAGSGHAVQFAFNVKNFEETATTSLVSPTGGAILLATFGDVGGGEWDDLTKSPDVGLFRPVTETDSSVDYAALKPDFLSRIANNDQTHGFYSEDAGASWTPFPSSPPYQSKDAQGNWHGPGRIAVSAAASSLVWAPERAAVFYSKDRGQSWKTSSGLPPAADPSLVPISDKAIDGVFYVLDRASSSILISVDGGTSFQPAVIGLPKIEGWQGAELAVVPGHIRDLWLAAPYGLMHSASAGQPMSAVQGVAEAWLVAFGMGPEAKAYPSVFVWGKLKGQEGIFRSDDEGKTWVRVNDDAHQFGTLGGMAGDLLEYKTLYIAPEGRGVMVGKAQP